MIKPTRRELLRLIEELSAACPSTASANLS
jgi:hypothetical protein